MAWFWNSTASEIWTGNSAFGKSFISCPKFKNTATDNAFLVYEFSASINNEFVKCIIKIDPFKTK